MFDFDRRLSEQMRGGAERITVDRGDVQSVMRRGRRRQRRLQTAVAGTALVAGAGLVTGVLVVNHRGGPHMTVQLDPGTATPPGTPLQLSWRTAPATSGLAAAVSLSDTGGDLYAVSTGPGVSANGDGQPILYRSTDGATWRPVPGSLDGSTSIAGVSGNSGVLYAVGTGPLNAAVGAPESVRVSSSHNGGLSFQGVDLPLDLGARGHTLQIDAITPEVAAGPQGVVVAVGPDLSFNLVAARPATASAAWAATPTGIEVLGAEDRNACGAGQHISPPGSSLPDATRAFARKTAEAARLAGAAKATGPQESAVSNQDKALSKQPSTPTASGPYQVFSVPCYTSAGGAAPVRSIAVTAAYPVTASYTWSQLGVSPQAALAIQGRPLVFFSPDGTHFHQVSVPDSVEGYGLQLTSGAGGFALATDSGAVLSTDGRTWSDPVPLPSESISVVGAGYVDGRLTLIGFTRKTSAAFTLSGSAWTTTPLPIDPMSISFGALGVAAVGFESTGTPTTPQWGVSFSSDGLHWSTKSVNALSAGNVGQAMVAVGASTVVVTVTRPPATASAPATTPAAQLALIGTPVH